MPVLTVRDDPRRVVHSLDDHYACDAENDSPVTRGGTERIRAAESTGPLSLELSDGRRVSLGAQDLTIGSGRTCDVVLADPAVSALHCRIVSTLHGWHLLDADSTNGTYVAGVPVRGVVLRPGLAIVVGRSRIRCEHGDEPASSTSATPVLLGRTPVMAAVRATIARYATSPFPVLVQGETGSGKELVARMLHEQSQRASGPFVAINAGAIAADVLESELFGHERGAFTGAIGRRRGVFEQASGGTLFLDEIGELPLAQQTRLLRVLETGEIRRVGGEQAVRVDARIVCATHRDLAARAATGEFRTDLLYRLDLLRVRLPPLRERMDDVPALASHLMQRLSRETGLRRRLDDRALAALLEHDWPGNVRELFGVLCRAAAESESEWVGIEHIDLPRNARRDGQSLTSQKTTDAVPLARDLDGDALRVLLDSCGGNISRLSRATGLARSTIRDRLRRSSVPEPGPEALVD